MISKKKFITTYNKYPPSKYMKFIYKYFSQSTLEEDLKPKKIFGYSLIILFFCGFIGTIIKLPMIYVAIPSFTIFGLLLIFAIATFIAFKTNQHRLKKIAKDLGINMIEYEKLRLKYMPNK